MSAQLLGGLSGLAMVGVKATLLYLTAVFAFRFAKRRTIAEMSPYDFVAAVAVGAIVGRVPNSSDTSYVAGACTLFTILLLHAIISHLSFFKSLTPLFDHPPRLLVAHGEIVGKELRRCALTQRDLFGLLRQNGVTDLAQVAYVIFEERGRISIIRREDLAADGGLVRDVLQRVKKV